MFTLQNAVSFWKRKEEWFGKITRISAWNGDIDINCWWKFSFFKRMFWIRYPVLIFFNNVYSWAFRCYDGTNCYLSLQGIIDYEEYMYKTGKKTIRFKVEMKLFLHFLEKQNVFKKSLPLSLFDEVCRWNGKLVDKWYR